MKFTKPPLSVDEQLGRLSQRGMKIGDLATARERLLHINYYRLRAYWLPDEVPGTEPGEHHFRRGTQFETILDLYSFDRRLRLMVMDAIERMEVSLRTRWAHVLAMKHGPHAYLDPSLFRNTHKHNASLVQVRQEYRRTRETFAQHYRNTYTEPELPPVWAICELLSFRQLSFWYSNLKRGADRAEIAVVYGLDEQIIQSFAHHLSYVRNLCAHHSRLWNREMTIGMKRPSHPEWLGASFNRQKPKRLYNTLVMLAYLMDILSPRSRWRADLLALFGQHPKVDLDAMGFPADWRDASIWEIKP